MFFRSPDHPITRSPDSPCYTSPFPPMSKTVADPGSPTRAGAGFCAWRGAGQRYAALIAVLCLGMTCRAQQEPPSPWQSSADEFVQQILSRAGSPTAISLAFANLSSLSANDQSAI